MFKIWVWLLIVPGANSSSGDGSVAPFMFQTKPECMHVAEVVNEFTATCIWTPVILPKGK